MPKTTENKKKLFIKAYIKHQTHISRSCKEVGINRGTYYKWVENDEDFVRELEESWEGYLDDVEEAIRKSAFGFTVETKEEKVTYQGDKVECTKQTYYPPNPTNLKLLAEAKMRHRGYGRKQSEDKGESGEEEVSFSDE